MCHHVWVFCGTAERAGFSLITEAGTLLACGDGIFKRIISRWDRSEPLSATGVDTISFCFLDGISRFAMEVDCLGVGVDGKEWLVRGMVMEVGRFCRKWGWILGIEEMGCGLDALNTSLAFFAWELGCAIGVFGSKKSRSFSWSCFSYPGCALGVEGGFSIADRGLTGLCACEKMSGV